MRRNPVLRTLVAVLLSQALFSAALADDPIPFVPTPMTVVNRMLEVAEITKSDVVYDLGSGDGRIVIEAAKKYGARGVGIDINPKLVELARSRAKEEGVAHLVEFRAEDALQVDISSATVVTLYMFDWFNNRIRPKLQQLKLGARIVAHDFGIAGWRPIMVEDLPETAGQPGELTRPHTVYLYKIDGSLPPM
jgi:SAM-dependent methyltransferase